MKIEGRAIAKKMLADLAGQVSELKKRNITPTLAVILVGENPASVSYIKQKQIAAEKIEVKLLLNKQQTTNNKQQLLKIIQQYNNDPSIHGIIVQRPLPGPLGSIYQYINILKDVDGFVPGSRFEVPVANAVLEILRNIKYQISKNEKAFIDWLQHQSIVIVGRGETAGAPTADLLIKKGCQVTVVHSQTKNPDDIIRSGDIVISCVGKPDVVRRDNIKQNSMLISVGLWRDSQGKLHGDYEESEIGNIASFYTPTPGGVGPVNVACLMKNLVLASQKIL